jgi:hypothetical protein
LEKENENYGLVTPSAGYSLFDVAFKGAKRRDVNPP